MINPGTILQARYLIEKQIGEGGMGAVYLATDQRFDNYVAIKETFYMDDEFGEAFEREAKILNGLVHPVLPHVSDYFTESGGHFLVMQFIEGEDVSDILKRDGAFPVREVLRWFDNLLEALDYLHSQEPPIIHRDLKPSNLKLTARGDIFLLDFGLAKLNKENTLSERSVFGYSRRYSPLEQIQGIGTDARSDLFALAATVFHLFTGKPPIDAIARASAIVAGNPDPLELASEVNGEVPPRIANILKTALALNAENRFVSANAMRQALKHAVQGTALEDVEILPEAALASGPAEPLVISPASDEDFPALAAFAAEKIEPPQVVPIPQAESAESPSSEIPAHVPPVPENVHNASRDGLATKIAPRARKTHLPGKRRVPMAAALALLAIVTIASGFFILSDENSAEPVQTAVETDNSVTSSNVAAPESVPEPAAQTVDNEAAAEKETMEDRPVAISVKKTAPESERAEADPLEKVEAESPENKTARPSAKKSAPKAKIPDIDKRERIVGNEPVPDIESIFTGRPSWERAERIRRGEERRRRNEELTDEEWREIRRERRRQRRQNWSPIPF